MPLLRGQGLYPLGIRTKSAGVNFMNDIPITGFIYTSTDFNSIYYQGVQYFVCQIVITNKEQQNSSYTTFISSGKVFKNS
jgi:hypothetical protein